MKLELPAASAAQCAANYKNMKTSKIIISFLILAALGAGVYFKDDVIRFYYNLNKQIEDFQKTEIGSTLSEISKEVLAPAPLKVGGAEKDAVLLKSKIIAETNLQRQSNGLPALKENIPLDNAASGKANDMFKNQYFEHESPSGIDPGELVSGYGYDYIVAGENLILGNFSSEKEVVENWMASPGHKENILNSRYAETGVAIIKGNYNGESVWIGVQEFGLPLSACPQPDAALKEQIDIHKSRIDAMLPQIEDRKSQIDAANQKSAAYRQMVDDYNRFVSQYNLLADQTKLEIQEYNGQTNIFNACVAGN